MYIYSEQFGEIRHINYVRYNASDIHHANFKILSTDFTQENLVDVLMMASFVGFAQAYLGFRVTINRFEGEPDLHYFISSYDQKVNSLVPYRIYKYSIFMRDSGTISRDSYIVGMFGFSYLIVTFCSILLVFLAGAVKKRTIFRFDNLSAESMSIFNSLVSNGDITSSTRTYSFRMIFLASTVLSMITWTALGAFLSAEQALRPERKPFTSLRGLIQLGTIQLCVDPKSMIYKYIRETESHPNLETILNGANCPGSGLTIKQYVQEMCQTRERVAFVEGHNFATEFNLVGKWLTHDNFPCKIVQIVENMFSFPRAIIFRPGFLFKKDFNQFFLRLSEVGVRTYIEAVATNRLKTFQQHQPLAEQWSDVRFPEVTFWMTRGLFQLLVATMALSGLTLIAERWDLKRMLIRAIRTVITQGCRCKSYVKCFKGYIIGTLKHGKP